VEETNAALIPALKIMVPGSNGNGGRTNGALISVKIKCEKIGERNKPCHTLTGPKLSSILRWE